MKKESLDEELGSISPWLNDLKSKGEGFEIPEDYFGDMEESLFARIEAAGPLERPALKPAKRSGMFASFIRPRAAMAYAAALAVLLAAVWLIRLQTTKAPETVVASAELSEEDIESYLLENVHDFDPDQLAALEPTATESMEEESAPAPSNPGKKAKTIHHEDLHPEDLEQIIDEMSDEELERML